MKKTLKLQKDSKKRIIIATLVAALYVALQYSILVNYMVTGFGLVIVWIMDVTNVSLSSMTLNYVSRFLLIVSPALIIGFLLAIFRQSGAIRIAFMSTMFTYFCSNIIMAALVGYIPFAQLIVIFLMMFVGYLLSALTVARIRRAVFSWAIIVCMVLINIFALPYVYHIVRMI